MEQRKISAPPSNTSAANVASGVMNILGNLS